MDEWKGIKVGDVMYNNNVKYQVMAIESFESIRGETVKYALSSQNLIEYVLWYDFNFIKENFEFLMK